MEWYSLAFQRYADFSGRSRRKEYWYFTLFNGIVSMILSVIDGAVGSQLGTVGILSLLYSLVVFIPSLAVAVRRLHDTNRSGWNLLWALLPIVGAIVLLVFMLQDSEQGSNKWGASPKYGYDEDIESIGQEEQF